MARKQLRTSNYPPEARARLGEAVEQARTKDGYRYRTEFCRAHGIKNLRGLELLEQGRPGVGQAFLFEVARALTGWTEETPRTILEGGPIPHAGDSPDDDQQLPAESVEDDEEWTEEDEEFYETISRRLAIWGLRPTPEIIQKMREEFERSTIENRDDDPENGSVTAS